uniref:OsmC family protein n=1 Tax=uncultured Draconibacterium sp. TaxID=1573823 RepID=UPI00321629CF
MNTDELKKLQTPLKDKYRTNPDAAIVTLRATGNIGDNISCKVDTGRALVEAGLHPATGGNGMMACSGDLLLEALVACAGVTLNAVATSIGVTLQNSSVTAEGDIDFRGTLGVSKDVPVGFREIRLKFTLNTDLEQEQIETLQKLTERYCVVFQTIHSGTSVKTVFE